MELTLQVFWENAWLDAGTINFVKPSLGLMGTPTFSYGAEYVVQAFERIDDFDCENLIDKSAVGVNLPCHFGGDYLRGEVAPVLRDIIPQGASRRLWVKNAGKNYMPRARNQDR